VRRSCAASLSLFLSLSLSLLRALSRTAVVPPNYYLYSVCWTPRVHGSRSLARGTRRAIRAIVYRKMAHCRRYARCTFQFFLPPVSPCSLGAPELRTPSPPPGKLPRCAFSRKTRFRRDHRPCRSFLFISDPAGEWISRKSRDRREEEQERGARCRGSSRIHRPSAL